MQVSGACVHSSSVGANFSIVTFGADIGDLENGKDTELRVSGGGFDHALKGKIFRATGEEGVSGVQVDIGNDDPLWRAFAEKDSLDYLVPGYKAASLDFTRGRDKIQQFVKACETFGDASPPARALPPVPEAMPRRRRSTAPRSSARSRRGRRSSPIIRPASAPISPAPISRSSVERACRSPPLSVNTLLAEADASCKDRSKLRSQNSKTPTKLTFINRSGAMRGILWLDFDGLPKDYANLNDREQVTLDTFMTHPWMITDGPGNCLGSCCRNRADRSSSLAAAAMRPSSRRRRR